MRKRRVFDGQRGLIAAIFVASLFVNILILTAPLYMLQLFTRVMTSGSMSTLLAISIGAAICLLFFFIFDAVRQRMTARLGARLEANHGPLVLSSLVANPEAPASMGIQPMRDLQSLRAFVSGPYFTSLLDAPWSIIFMGVIYLFHPVLGAIATAGILILFLLGVVSEFTGREPNAKAAEAARDSNIAADEMLRNAEIVRAMGRAPGLLVRWQKLSLTSLVYGTKANDRVSIATSLAKMVRMGLQIAILGVGVILVIQNQLSPGLMIAASILLGRAVAPVESSIAGWRAFLEVRMAKKRLSDLLAHIDNEGDKLPLPEPQGRLSVENATVVINGLQDPVLFDVSFQLEPGSSLGIIGPSGAGKTTLARALVGIQTLSRGYIRVDDSALTDWPTLQIGQYIGFLPQRVELLDGTVADNIATMDETADPADVVEAAKLAEVHDLILALPDGYNTEVGPRGERLSAGQRQRIGLARAFFGSRRIVVLDEPNANLDPAGEEALARAVENATARGAVVIIVTHRMSILRRVTHAAVMENGRMVRFGAARSVLDAIVQPMANQQSDGTSNVSVFRSEQRRAAENNAIQQEAQQ